MAPPDPSVVRIDGPWRHLEVHANGIRFHVVEADGRRRRMRATAPTTERPLVILLHGFGSFWWSWRHQLRGLTGARVVAVDLRGYGGSDKPPRGYDGWTLAGDTAGLVRALGHHVGDAGRPRRRRSGLLGDLGAASADGPRDRGGQLTASRRTAGLGADPARPGPGAAAVDAALSGADVAGAVADPPRRRGAGTTGAKPCQCEMACLRRLFRDHSPHAAGHPDSVGGALGAGVPALGGAQPAARRGPALHAVDEAAAGRCRCCTCAATPTRTCWPTRCTAPSATRRTVATYPSPAQDISATKKHRRRSTTSCRASWRRCTR